MKLRLERFEYGDTFTIGKFYINGASHCFSLEDILKDKLEVDLEKMKNT